MKQLFFGTLFFLLISACGTKDEQSKPLKFKNSKDELSYVLGAINAKTIVSSGETSFANLDKDQLIKGFNENLSATPADDCLPELKKLFGPTYQDFNKKYIKSGSRCMGKMTGHAFYSDIKKLGGLPLVNLAMVKKGYADGLFLRDTVMKEAQMRQIMQDFMLSLNEKAGMKMLDKAKKTPGATVFDNGIILFTIKEGKGAYPNPTDTGLPKYYAIFGPQLVYPTELSLILTPTPDANYNVELHYYYMPESITTTASGTTWLSDNYDPVLFYGAMREAMIFMKGEADMVGYYEQKYQEALGQLKRLGDGLERGDSYRNNQTKLPYSSL